MPGPGSALFIGKICRSHPSASVAALKPGVRYAEHVGTSHSIQAIVCFSGTAVSGIVTPIEPSAVRCASTLARAAARPASSVPPPAVVSVPPPAVVSVLPPAVVSVLPPAVVSVDFSSSPQAPTTMPATAMTARTERNFLMDFPLVNETSG